MAIRAKIHIKTFGCSLNQADSEAIAGLLVKEGYKLSNLKDADLAIVNTCTVKGPTETNFAKYLKKIKQENKKAKVVIAGCLPQAEDKQEIIKRFPDYSVMGVFQLEKVVHVVEETLAGNKIYFLEKKRNKQRLSLPIIRRNEVIEIIPTNNGCLGSCTYCKTRFARGKLSSYPKKEIINRIREAVSDGAKEIWLTSQDLGAYGKDIKSSLPSLIEDIIRIKGEFRVRLGMMNPNFAKIYADKLIGLLKSKKLFKFLHIPVQSGNDRILKLMNRRYNSDDFRELVKRLREAIPEITIATDVIAGFPSETKEEFIETVEMIKELEIDVLNISRFWPRPGTKAAGMKSQIHGAETKRRSQLMTEAFRGTALERNKFWKGRLCPVLVDERGKNGTFVGRNDAYKPVIVQKGVLGQTKKVKISSFREHYLIAKD